MDDLGLSMYELSELASMALAAMDSESGCLPLDYLQGHKDGLEWAAQLAEANHPETGDWLYDDPIELAKAIRKGPDMPPAQPVADSEPVIVVGDDGGDALSYRRLIQSFEPGTKLYRHAQQPVVSAELLHTAASAIEDLLTTKDRMGVYVCFDLPFRLRSAANAQPAPVVPENCVTAEHRRVIEMLLNVCGAAFELADDSCQQDVDGEDCHVVPDDAFQKLSDALDEIENTLPTEDIDRPDVFLAWSAIPKAALKSLLQAGNSPVTGIDLASGPDRTVEVRYVAPPGYVMVPMRLTAENGAKGALSGEFSETKFVNCPECFGDDECETCDGSGRIEITVPVTWTTIKEIWAKGVEHFAAAPQEDINALIPLVSRNEQEGKGE
nr:hypothetical protein [Klebsiella pneumoniae]